MTREGSLARPTPRARDGRTPRAWGRRRGGRRTSEREELESALGIRVSCRRRRIRPRGEALASEKIRRVSTPGDVDHLHAELGQSIEPASLLVGHVALLLEPLQAGIVRVELEWAVQKIWAEDLQGVDDGEQLQQVRQVGPLRGCQLTRLVGDGMPGASIVRLLEDRRNSQLRRVSNRLRGPRGLPHPQHGRRHQGGLELLEAALFDRRPPERGLRAAQPG